MNNKNLQENAEVNEFLTADEQKITELVGSLEKVSAPNDFEFRLKARIAAGEGENYQTGYWQWLRYLLPVGASAFVLAFVLYTTNFFAPSQPVDNVAETKPARSEEVVTKPIEMSSNTFVAVANSNKAEDLPVNSSSQKASLSNVDKKQPILIADKTDSNKIELQPKPKVDDNFNGSRVLGTDPVNKQIFPLGTDPNKIIPKPQEFKGSGSVELTEMLSVNGIEAVSEGGKLKVKSIKQNSPADRAGVKIDDIIESFDEQKASGNNNSTNLGGARKLIVSRDGKIMSFDFKSN